MSHALRLDSFAKTAMTPASSLINMTRFRHLSDIISQKNSDIAPPPMNYQAAVINFRLPLNGARKIHFD